MHDLEANADSVNFLINVLIRCIARQHGAEKRTSVAKLKAQSFEILLKRIPSREFETNDDFEPHRALDVKLFAAKLKSKSISLQCTEFGAFDDYLALVEDHQYFQEGVGKKVVQLLLELHGNIKNSSDVNNVLGVTPLLLPAPFTIHASYHDNKENKRYPTKVAYIDHLPEPKLLKGLLSIQTKKNPYLPPFSLHDEPNMLARVEERMDKRSLVGEKNRATWSFTGMTKMLLDSLICVNAEANILFCNKRESGLFYQPEKRTHNTVGVSESTNWKIGKNTKAVLTAPEHEEERKIFSWNWESIGELGVVRSKPFASEANVGLHLHSVHLQGLGESCEIKIVSLQQFLHDLKLLTVGIQSDTFTHDEFIIFSMKPNISVGGLLPATVKNFVIPFLECGTCYKRMQTMIKKRDYKLMFEGFVFKAICSALDEYLITFRQNIVSRKDVYLLQFYKRIKKLMKQIVNLSYTFAIHPCVKANIKPPMGSQFLGYLYNEIMRVTESDYLALLVFILKRCCHVYFKHLQKWIFYGLLDDSSNELLVGFVDHYRPNTKYYYDRAYFLRKESVPGFFQNIADQILQCGKYMLLLKAFKPNHPLLEMNYPGISVCLSYDEIKSTESTCFKYLQKAREICGKPITIDEIFKLRSDNKRKFFELASARVRLNIDKWTAEQYAFRVALAEQKKKCLDELTEQLKDNSQRKIDERRANVELELRTLREAEKLEERRALSANINLRKRIEYYQELNDTMQGDVEVAQAKLVNRLFLERKMGANTPDSTGEDFHSCDGGEDDRSSEYAECISDNFLMKFAQSADELQSFCNQNQSENNNLESNIKSDTELIKQPEHNVNLKRSASDCLNSNELPAIVMTVMNKNREKVMSGASVQDCLKETTLGVKVAAVDTKIVPPLTEAQRNKLKVLEHEFGILQDDCHATDVNSNTVHSDSHADQSELKRNRQRMMQNDTFSELNKKPLLDRRHLNLELDSDRARNRQKVLESEYHILTGKRTVSTTTFVVEEPMTPITPMSTTSDLISPNADDASEQVLQTTTASKSNDLENGNSDILASKPILRIDVVAAAAADKTEKIADDYLHLDTSASQLSSVTPEFALNTAGLMAKQGFSFHSEQLQMQNKQNRQQAAVTEAPVQNSKLLSTHEQLFPRVDYKNPYKRCKELIETNFRCDPLSPFFRLNIHEEEESLEGSKSDKISQPSREKHMTINCISVVMLTEFLQKSIVIPMSAHLEVVNNEIMRMFLGDLEVLSHFKSLRNYFFLMDGEFAAFICDGIIAKLEEGTIKPEKLFNYQLLQSILENALELSILGYDKNAANLSFIMVDVPVEFDLTQPQIFDNLCLSYHVDWPLNLILSTETIAKYARIFKHLIKVRRISWVLENTYKILKHSLRRHGNALLRSPQYCHVQQIRHKIYHFVQSLQNHTTNSLLASWKTFKDDLLTAETMEDIYYKHANYLKRINFLCMLKRQSAPFYKTLENIFHISLKFYTNLKVRDFKIYSGEEHYCHPRYEILAANELEFNEQLRHIIYLGNKIVDHGYQEEVAELIDLINYNDYYS